MFVVVVTHGAGDPQNPPTLVGAVRGPFCSKIQAQEWIDARKLPESGMGDRQASFAFRRVTLR